MKHKKLFITGMVIFTVLVAFTIFIMLWFWGDTYKGGRDYEGFKDFRVGVDIPGLEDGACPQGITSYNASYTVTDEDGKETSANQDYFFISSYFKDKASRIYVVGSETGEVGYVSLKNEDGSDYTGHCGGVATNGYTLWVSSDDRVFVAQKESSTTRDNIATDIIKLAAENGEVTFTSSFAANCNASFLFFYDADGGASKSRSSSDRLYVGEFYRGGNYETSETHHLTTPRGDEHRAFVYEYYISVSDNDYGLSLITSDKVAESNRVPMVQKVFSVTDEIQGFARTSNGLVLSQSYGLKNSNLYYHTFYWNTSDLGKNNRKPYTEVVDKRGFFYDGVKTKGNANFYDNTTIYVYYVDGSNLANRYSIPSMSEGLCVVDERVHVLFESGAKKYKWAVRQALYTTYSFIPRKNPSL